MKDLVVIPPGDPRWEENRRKNREIAQKIDEKQLRLLCARAVEWRNRERLEKGEGFPPHLAEDVTNGA